MPGINGGFLWYKLSEQCPSLVQSKPHILEQQNIVLMDGGATGSGMLNLYPSQKTMLMSLPEKNMEVQEFKIYGSNLQNPNTEPSPSLGLKQK